MILQLRKTPQKRSIEKTPGKTKTKTIALAFCPALFLFIRHCLLVPAVVVSCRVVSVVLPPVVPLQSSCAVTAAKQGPSIP